jgi:ABC-type transporter Mla subunit MlaD
MGADEVSAHVLNTAQGQAQSKQGNSVVDARKEVPHMEQTLLVVVVVLVSALVGAAVPALLQLRRTLRAAEAVLETTGARLSHTLDEVSGAAEKIQRVAGHLEGGVAELQKLLGAAGSVADSLGELREALRGILGGIASIGPAIAGAIHTVAGRVTEGRGERPERAASE